MTSPKSLQFATQVVHTLRDTLRNAGRALNLDLRLELPAWAITDSTTPEGLLDAADKVQAQAGPGTVLVPMHDANPDSAIDILRRAWRAGAVARVQLVNSANDVQQGELLADMVV